MPVSRITFANRAYGRAWLKNFKRQAPQHFAILRALIDEIVDKQGGDLVKADLYTRRPDIAELIRALDFDPVPSRGQMLKHNGNGIRHAKFAPSKGIALVWEKIGETIYLTFDDHAPIRYHRAIAHLRDIKLGKPVFERRRRNTGRFLRNLKRFWQRRHNDKLRGFDPRDHHYE